MEMEIRFLLLGFHVMGSYISKSRVFGHLNKTSNGEHFTVQRQSVPVPFSLRSDIHSVANMIALHFINVGQDYKIIGFRYDYYHRS